ncbi:hypothetical protein C8J57DRAFT_1253199 [Mycena rebaudengoi]|nr:hypothetical protein C8J57DRAFT_1253199 [Mycena rebaudengoi]
MITPQETRRLFGAVNRPPLQDKSLELFPAEDLQATFGRPIKLRVAMGSADNFTALGKIQAHYVQDHRLVSQATPVLPVQVRTALRAYRTAYDTYFMSQGDNYRVRNAHAKHVLQAAEQKWHDWVVPYLAARGIASRPGWALEPLPGFQRVHVTPAPAAPAPAPVAARASTAAVETPRKRRHQLAFPTPTTPPSSPVRTEAAPSYSTPARLGEPVAGPSRKRISLGVIDISDDSDVEEAPPRKRRFLGFVDLTN